MIARGSQLPHFQVTTVDGRAVRYSTMWQQRNLVLIQLPPRGGEDYLSRLSGQLEAIAARDADCVITRDPIDGVPAPGALIADRWGEVVFAATADSADKLPDPEDLLDWLAYVQVRCPECEGEAL